VNTTALHRAAYLQRGQGCAALWPQWSCCAPWLDISWDMAWQTVKITLIHLDLWCPSEVHRGTGTSEGGRERGGCVCVCVCVCACVHMCTLQGVCGRTETLE